MAMKAENDGRHLLQLQALLCIVASMIMGQCELTLQLMCMRPAMHETHSDSTL